MTSPVSEELGRPAENPWLRRLPALVLSHLVGTANVVSVMAMAPVISADLGLTATQFGAFISSYYGAQACGSMPAGGITDRYGVGRTLIGAHVVMAAAAVMLSLAEGYIPCLVAMFLMGLGYSMNNPSTARGVLEWFPREKRGTAMGIKQVGVPLGGMLGALNGALAAYFDWQDLMLGIALLIGINGFFVVTLIKFHVTLPPEKRRSVFGNMGAVLRDWNFTRYAVLSGMLNFGQANFFAFLTLFFTEALRASQQMAGFAIGLAQTSSAVARVGWGILSDRRYAGRRKVLKAWICGTAAVFLALFPLFDGAAWLWPALGLTLALGITIASFAPIGQAIAVEAVDPGLSGSAMGVNMLGVHIGGMLGPVIFGAVADRFGGYDIAWLVTAGVVAAGTCMLIFWFREGRPGYE